MDITGTVKKIYPQVEVGSNGYVKREFVIEHATNPQYPQFIKFELGKNQVGEVDGISEGDTVNVQFDLNGREWTNAKGETTYFNTIKAWRVELSGKAGQLPTQQQSAPPQPPQQQAMPGMERTAADNIPY